MVRRRRDGHAAATRELVAWAEGCYRIRRRTSNDPAAMALADGAADWHLLLQFDSDYVHTGIDFGDSGRIYLAIHDHDLAARRWDRTWLTLQCY